jgi:glycerol-3-phosphate dehydrogenase subunit B
MDIKADLLVIGGGMAGLVAGMVGAEAGLKVVVLRKGQGATAISSGAVDIISYLPGADTPFASAIEGLHALSEIYPLHPYSVLGYSDEGLPSDAEKVVARVGESVNWLKEKLSGTPSALVGDLSRSLQAVTMLGSSKPTSLVQETMFAEGSDDWHDSVVLFAGFRGFPDFNPSMAAKAFLDSRLPGENKPRRIANCTLEALPFETPYNISSFELARYADREDGLLRVAKLLREHVKSTGADFVAFPPVLGLRRARANKAELEEKTGAVIFELLAFPPSVPGLRLQTALESTLNNEGGRVLIGHEAVSIDKREEHIHSVKVKTPRRTLNIIPSAVVLASGKFIGGGLRGDERGISETLMGLTVVDVDSFQTEGMRPQRLTNVMALNSEGHPLFGLGIAFDSRFRPVGPDGQPVADNMFAAGSMLSRYNYLTEKSGLGVALSTGYAAGTNAADYVKGVLS